MFQEGSALKDQIIGLMDVKDPEKEITGSELANDDPKAGFDKVFPDAAKTVENCIKYLVNSRMEALDAVEVVQDYLDERFGEGCFVVNTVPPGLELQSPDQINEQTVKILGDIIRDLPAFAEQSRLRYEERQTKAVQEPVKKQEPPAFGKRKREEV